MKVEVYSDVVCPWCYIGERRLARALATLPPGEHVEVVFRPFQLDPGAPDQAIPLAQYLERRFGRRMDSALERVTAAARGEDISIHWDTMSSANTRTAHRLLTWAEQHYGADSQCALAEELFALYFTHGGNIADIEQLAAAAAAAGMDGDRARAYLESDEGVQALEEEFDRARQLGIQAVPTFVIDGRYAVQGAQPVATFISAFQQAADAQSLAERQS